MVFHEGKARITKRIIHEDYAYSFLCAFALCFTYFVFAPLEMVMSNREDYWFGILDLLKAMLPVFMLALGVAALVLRFLHGKARVFATAVLFACFLGLYLQGNLPLFDYGTLDGSHIEWDVWNWNRIASLVIWVLCFGGAGLLFLLGKEKLSAVIRYVCVCILLVQMVTLITLGIQPMSSEAEETIQLKEEGKMTLSPEKNFIVFILDTIDGAVMTDFLAENEEYETLLSDFTFYRNTSGMYPRTRASVPYIITGVANLNTVSYAEWLYEAYPESPLLLELKKQGYDTRLYIDNSMFSETARELVSNAGPVRYRASSNKDLAVLIAKLVGTRYLPHECKKYVWMYSSDLLSVRLEDTSGAWEPVANADYEINDDLNFNRQLRKEGLRIVSDAPAFRLYHLTGTHKPYTINEKIEYVPDGSEWGQLAGSLNGVIEYIDQMKEKSVYDESTIIVMSDHGSLNLYQNPVLMIKPAQTHGDGLITTDAPVSYEDLQATFVDLLGGDTEGIGRSALTIGETEERERLFYSWPAEADAGSYLLPLSENKITGHVADMASLEWTGMIYEQDGARMEKRDQSYSLGKKVTVSGGTFNRYVDYGVSFDTYSGRAEEWSVGDETSLTFELTDYNGWQDLYCCIGLPAVLDKQKTVQIYVNDHEAELIQVEAGTLYLHIDASLMVDNTLNIRLKYIDARMPEDDYRTLAVLFSSAFIDVIEPVSYEDGRISFSRGAKAEQYLLCGFGEEEDTHRWTDGTRAEMEIPFIGAAENDVEMEIRWASILDGSQPASVFADDRLIFEGTVIADERFVLTIPRECLMDGVVRLRFDLPGAHQNGEDVRQLALDFGEIRFNSN